MPWGVVAGAAIGAVGSAMSANSAEDAANTQANAQTEAARISADAAKFRPVGITSRFGSSNFQFDNNGYLSGAGYSVSPELQLLQNFAMNNALNSGADRANQFLSDAGKMQRLGEGYLAQSPEQAAQSWMAAQQNLLAPSRERQLAGVRNGLFQSGREGLAVGATGARPDGSAGLGAANPEMEAYYNALAQQDAGLATQAQEQGRAQTQFGNSLLSNSNAMASSAFNPITAYLGLGSTIEDLGSKTLSMGSELGGRASTAGNSVGQFLMQGGMAAANTMGAVNGYNPWGAALQGAASNPRIQGMFSQYMQPQQTNYAGSAGGNAYYPDYGMSTGGNGAWV